MSHQLIKIDAPIELLSDFKYVRKDNDTPRWWMKTTEQVVNGINRLYYVACPPYRVLVVMQNGEDIRNLNRTEPIYVRAHVGKDPGTAGFVLPEETGRFHTKISVVTTYNFAHDDAARVASADSIRLNTWSELLGTALRSDRRGGARGTQGNKPLSEDEATMRVSASVPASYLATLRKLGDGDLSAGVRRAIELAKESES